MSQTLPIKTPDLAYQLRRLAEVAKMTGGTWEVEILTIAANRLERLHRERLATDKRLANQREEILFLQRSLARCKGLKPDPQVVA